MQENHGSNDGVNAETFPEPVRVPDGIQHERRERTYRLTRVAFLGVGVRLLIIVIELAGFSYWHYSVLLVDCQFVIFFDGFYCWYFTCCFFKSYCFDIYSFPICWYIGL